MDNWLIIFCLLVILFAEGLMFWVVAKKSGYRSLGSLIFIIMFFYANASMLDYLLLGIEYLDTTEEYGFPLNDWLHVKALSLHALFLLAYTFGYRFTFRNWQSTPRLYFEFRLGPAGWAVAIGVLFLLLYYSYVSLGLDRFSSKSLVAHPVLFLGYQFSLFVVAVLISECLQHHKVLWLASVTVMFLFTFASFEREPIAIFAFYGFFALQGKKIGIRSILVIAITLFVAFAYKPFYVFVVQNGDWGGFWILLQHRSFSFAGLDPGASMYLLMGYLENGGYEEYRFSYFTNTLDQFFRALGISFKLSLGEHATAYRAMREAGIGFSVIVESMLNFWYMGPIVTGSAIGALTMSIQYYFSLARGLLVVYSLLIVLFMRTELAVILKLNFIPLLLLFFLFYRVKEHKRLVISSSISG